MSRWTSSRRAPGPLAIAGLVAVTLLVATALSRRLFEGPNRPTAERPTPPRSKVPGPPLFRVAAIEGPVEALHEGRWYVVQAGDLLSLQDVIRTPKGSRALLRRGSTEIEVREEMDIRLDSLAAKTARFDVIRGGRVVANVAEEAERLEITARDTRAVNEGVARWVVSQDPSGRVSVASSRGDVRFAAAGKEVTVGTGAESTAAPGQAPRDPEPIPEELLLSVEWPEIERPQPTTVLEGQVSPSTRVKVNGVEAPVDIEGRFSAAVPLSVGANPVAVEARDIAGRSKTEAQVIRRVPKAPALQPMDEEIWKK